ncbi:hypothetical protein VNI00_016554 [Paramarasmius palmivorus]|uniref:Uncharacterized protein n=1 Tax=Paramarasmius palmivorus TaxID=297713 RepID=A0AAW0BEY9_9AGAR
MMKYLKSNPNVIPMGGKFKTDGPLDTEACNFHGTTRPVQVVEHITLRDNEQSAQGITPTIMAITDSVQPVNQDKDDIGQAIPFTQSLQKLRLCSPDGDVMGKPVSKAFDYDFTSVFNNQKSSFEGLRARLNIASETVTPVTFPLAGEAIEVYLTNRTQVRYHGMNWLGVLQPKSLILATVRVYRLLGFFDKSRFASYRLYLELAEVDMLMVEGALDVLLNLQKDVAAQDAQYIDPFVRTFMF